MGEQAHCRLLGRFGPNRDRFYCLVLGEGLRPVSHRLLGDSATTIHSEQVSPETSREIQKTMDRQPINIIRNKCYRELSDFRLLASVRALFCDGAVICAVIGNR